VQCATRVPAAGKRAHSAKRETRASVRTLRTYTPASASIPPTLQKAEYRFADSLVRVRARAS
jgi:hypothetical protein